MHAELRRKERSGNQEHGSYPEADRSSGHPPINKGCEYTLDAADGSGCAESTLICEQNISKQSK